MPEAELNQDNDPQIAAFLKGKSLPALDLFTHFLKEYAKLGKVRLYPAKSMIGISVGNKRIAWVTQIGKNFVHVVFPFHVSYTDNLCFTKIVEVPGEIKQYNHHLRLFYADDVNSEVIHFMKLALHEAA